MIPEPIDDEQFPCVCIVADDTVTVLQPVQDIRHLVPLQSCLERDGFDTDLITAAEIGMPVGQAVQVDIPLFRREIIHHLRACPKAGVDAADSTHALPPFDEAAEGTRSRKESESRQALPDDTTERDQALVAGSGSADQEQETGSADEAAKTLTHLDPPPTIRTSGEAAAARPWHSCRSRADHRYCFRCGCPSGRGCICG